MNVAVMSNEKDYELVLKGNELRFEKTDFDYDNYKNNDGVPILGWIDTRHLGSWINFLNPNCPGTVPEFLIRESPEINEEHITLYSGKKKKLIGWIDKSRKTDLCRRIFEYLRNREVDAVREVETEKKADTQEQDVQDEDNQNNHSENRVQLSLF